ncbi:AbrB family transcriptional regulator [Roseospira marina]|uniref:AbrB family transcriptional regulator n=1 Tax=Roseospira marina TaxID=140057 RepID=A0A5M6IAG8_9PROT|nr:AbrB family transcriptional regulator [Roseospira marina]KAA5605264.1 AbrB family transcriptional regulator [Roseospira marina]MBB4314724.1 hypothetical protein [Roseospira marina]MBB5087713.1 hypothetical protein [Roseospira marina]
MIRPSALKQPLGRFALALGVGLAGGLVAAAVGLPAPWLMGSAVAVSLVALAGVPVAIPALARNAAFAMIGMSMGSAITVETLRSAVHWPLSLVVMALSLAVAMVLGVWYLRRFGGFDGATAVLATAPGGLAFSLALATEGHGDVRRVTVNQSLRLLTLTAIMPLLVGTAAAPTHGAAARTLALDWTLPTLVTACLAGGWTATRLRVPAGFLLGSMAVSVAAHIAGVVEGRPPAWLLAPGFVVTGGVIGTRFLGVTRADLWLGLHTASVTVLIALGVTGVAAIGVAWALALPLGQVWVAYAPGGVESMAAMALALGYDPAYVATHHVARLIVLTALLPLLLRLAEGRRSRDRR